MDLADFIFLPQRDAVSVCGLSEDLSVAKICQELHRIWPKATVLVTLGSLRSSRHQRRRLLLPAICFPSQTKVERLGGGDAFSAGSPTAFLEGMDVPDSLTWAAAAAAQKYTLPGDLPLFDRDMLVHVVEHAGPQSPTIRRYSPYSLLLTPYSLLLTPYSPAACRSPDRVTMGGQLLVSLQSASHGNPLMKFNPLGIQLNSGFEGSDGLFRFAELGVHKPERIEIVGIRIPLCRRDRPLGHTASSLRVVREADRREHKPGYSSTEMRWVVCHDLFQMDNRLIELLASQVDLGEPSVSRRRSLALRLGTDSASQPRHH